jgi:CHAD domain-containing protein
MKPSTQPDPAVSKAPLWVAARTLLAAHGEDFFSRRQKILETFDQEEIHDLRVASRRLREGLTLFAPCFSPKKVKGLRKEARKITRMLGEARNADEAVSFFSGLSAQESSKSGPELELLLSELRREREEAHLKLKEELTALDPVQMQGDFRSILQHPRLFGNHSADPFLSINLFATVGLTTRLYPALKLLPQASVEADGASQHQLRIALKKFRYRMEIVAPAMSGGFEELRDALKEYQDLLGKLHDLDVFREMVENKLEQGGGREALLRVVARKRRALYQDFTTNCLDFPIEDIGRRAKEALS